VAIVAFYILPDFPKTTTWLSQQERDLAMWRLEEDIGEEDRLGEGKSEGLFHGLKLAMVYVSFPITSSLGGSLALTGSGIKRY
jgi:hypothetical protein